VDAIVKLLARLPVARPGGEWNSLCHSASVAPFPGQVTLQPVCEAGCGSFLPATACRTGCVVLRCSRHYSWPHSSPLLLTTARLSGRALPLSAEPIAITNKSFVFVSEDRGFHVPVRALSAQAGLCQMFFGHAAWGRPCFAHASARLCVFQCRLPTRLPLAPALRIPLPARRAAARTACTGTDCIRRGKELG
jgi:hypothetical protein